MTIWESSETSASVKADIQASFWDTLRQYAAVLAPVARAIVSLQFDQANLSDAYASFMSLRYELAVSSLPYPMLH